MSFIHLHNHTQYSLLDGACRVDRMIDLAKKYEMPAVAITDHGNMYGAIEFYTTARKKGIKPIIGIETYIINHDLDDEVNKNDTRHHLILLAMNLKGYKNLMKLSSKAFIEGMHYKARISKNLLVQYNEGLVCLSACVKGEIPTLILNGRIKEAENVIAWYKSVFGERFFVEIQDHGLDSERDSMPALIELARNTQTPIVLTNDCHYLQQSDSEAHDILLCIQTGKQLNDPNRMRYNTSQLYFKSPEEMEKVLEGIASRMGISASELEDAYSNTMKINAMIDLELDYDRFLLPEIETPAEFQSMGEYLRHLCYEAAGSKYPELTEEIRSRIEYELGVIDRMGFNGYFLVVKDIIDNALRQDVPVGPGRGSAAGSIISYLLGITRIDPIRYGLFFERFLNPERISMPDIDIDFCAQGRSKVIEYMIQRYGRNSVTQIITYGTLGPKTVIRDVARVLEVSAQESQTITKTIPLTVKTLEEALKTDEFNRLINSNELYQSILKHSFVLEGLIRQIGVHAAGVVIVPGDLTDRVPLATNQKEGDSSILVQYEGKWLNELKLLKLDILGLKTLTQITKTCELIRQSEGISLEPDSFPLDDKKTFDLLAKGRTDGVFQFESEGMKKHMIDLKPRKFEDLIAMVALYRPGPMQFIESFINRKHGREKVVYDHPLVENALKETYGVTVYQEQVMQISQAIAGFSGADADSLRSAMSKKKYELMQAYYDKFLAGATANGVPQSTVDKIWQGMLKFAEYAFNKSHATCYAFVAFQTAYLKAHYPVEFMAALLSLEDNPTSIIKLVNVCKTYNIKIIPPNINRSESEFRVHGKEILFGLRAIKNIGESAIRAIIEERDTSGAYRNVFEFCSRLDSMAVNKTALEALICSGAMDDLEGTRAQKYAVIEQALSFSSGEMRDRKMGQTSLFDLLTEDKSDEDYYPPLPACEPWTYLHQLDKERDALGFYVSGHPLMEYSELFARITNSNSATAEQTGKSRQNSPVIIAGIAAKASKKRSNKGMMAFLEFEDLFGKFEIPLFGKDYDDYYSAIQMGKVYLIIGVRSQYNTGEDNILRIMPREIIGIEDISRVLKGQVYMEFNQSKLTNKLITELKLWQKRCSGNFSLATEFHTANDENIKLLSDKARFFPDNKFCEFCGTHGIKLSVRLDLKEALSENNGYGKEQRA